MLKIRSWAKWQGEALYDRLRKRVPSGRSKPVTLAYFAVSSNLDDESGHFARFARAVGNCMLARGYLVAVLGHVARDAAASGVLRCSRDQLGRILSDRLTEVSRKSGEIVYDALLDSGICEEIDPADIRDIRPPDNRSHSPPPSREASPEDAPPSGRHLPGAEESERRGENYPPPPSKGASVASAAHNGHDVATRPLRPRERERFGKVLDYAVLIGTTAEQAMARVDREAHRRGPLSDDRIAELLAGRYAWVTRQKLARWLAEGRVGWRDRRDAAEQAPRRVTAHPAELCQRHGRPMPCTVCDVTTTAPADPAVAAKAIADAQAALARRPTAATAHLQVRPEVPATTDANPVEYERKRNAGLAALGSAS